MIYPTVTGLDIGHHSIKAVSVRLKKGQLELVGCIEILLSETVFLDANTLHLEKIKPYLSRLKKKLKFNQKRVAFSIPDSSIISKIIQVDSGLDVKETEFSISHTFEQQSSFLVDDLNIDFVAIDQRGVSSLKTTTYQVFAARKELVQSRQECFKSVGLSPVLADVHSHSLSILWQKSTEIYPDKKNWMLIDIGHQQTMFCISSPNQKSYSKHIVFGASEPNQERKNDLSLVIDLEFDAQFISQLSDHIRRQITLYSSIHNHKIEGVWITGGGSLLPGLSDSLSYELSLPVLDLNLSSLFKGAKQEAMPMNAQANQYASALGLALRGVEWITK
ncbi:MULTISPECIES: type IV pilus biogenesis protein PilM [unclassified Aliivibrio]|uniref:type IV pilus biogenesis protein PilM n=1 Tax=unclassified Aliivibrio TaxID=2645654 RepID=UPI00080ECF74|nr:MULTISPECIES: type IV pilus assembly protein PilM [unclassified Aliivibrio]OCH13297.1 pilus assembly protein PilM [Aliivibrio sp. 1S165]OCH25298.1 pilus assembly protein PilM [Aliivibrio sp. 1S128]OCH28013.1 pilus assembly protein PilM [Aliivibrio sp. 1S175]